MTTDFKGYVFPFPVAVQPEHQPVMSTGLLEQILLQEQLVLHGSLLPTSAGKRWEIYHLEAKHSPPAARFFQLEQRIALQGYRLSSSCIQV